MNTVAHLDAFLAKYGTTLTMRRMTTPVTDLTVRAAIRPFGPEDITGGVVAGDYKVVISPTGLDDAAWISAFATTGGVSQPAPFDVDPKLPKRGDKAIIDNRLRNIEHVKPIEIGGQVVRIEMQVR